MVAQGEAIAGVATTSPCVLRPSAPRLPALPLFPAPSPAPTASAGLPDQNAKSANGKATIIIAPNILICHLPFMQELPA